MPVEEVVWVVHNPLVDVGLNGSVCPAYLPLMIITRSPRFRIRHRNTAEESHRAEGVIDVGQCGSYLGFVVGWRHNPLNSSDTYSASSSVATLKTTANGLQYMTTLLKVEMLTPAGIG